MRRPAEGLANLDLALQYAHDVPDSTTSQLLRRALFVVIGRAYDEEIRPQGERGEFDALFYVQALEKLFVQRDKLLRILSGENLDSEDPFSGLESPE
jgi:hypothetical protein